MAMLAIPVPEEISALLRKIKVEGEPASTPQHITLFYLGDKVSIRHIGQALEATYWVVQDSQPFAVRIDHVSSFPKGEDGVPIICPVRDKALNDFRATLKDAFDRDDVSYSNRFPTFKGHVTLAYHNGKAPEDREIPALTWTVTEVILYGGDEGDERLTVRFPLGGPETKTAFYRGLVRLGLHDV